MSKAFLSLAGPIVAGHGSPYIGESWKLSKMLVTSAQKIAPTISDRGVAMTKLGPAVILMPRAAVDRNPDTKIAVMHAGDSLTYRITTMRDLAAAYNKAINGAGFGFFDILFDAGEARELPGLAQPRRDNIPLGPGTQMRPSEWTETKRQITNRIAVNERRL